MMEIVPTKDATESITDLYEALYWNEVQDNQQSHKNKIIIILTSHTCTAQRLMTGDKEGRQGCITYTHIWPMNDFILLILCIDGTSLDFTKKLEPDHRRVIKGRTEGAEGALQVHIRQQMWHRLTNNTASISCHLY